MFEAGSVNDIVEYKCQAIAKMRFYFNWKKKLFVRICYDDNCHKTSKPC